MREPAHGLKVLRKHIRTGLHHGVHVARDALKVRRQCLHCRARTALLDRAYALRVMRGAAVSQIIAVDRSQHHVLEPQQRDALGQVGRLVGIKPAARVAGVDRAEAAGARAYGAHQHDRGGAGVPALADVRALGLLAHGRESVLAHRAAHELVAVPGRKRRAQPARLTQQCVAIDTAVRFDAVLDRAETLRGSILLAAAHCRRGGARRRRSASTRARIADDRNALEAAHGVRHGW